MRIQIPDEVTYIIEKLNQHGYEAYAVGGCVRDSILGRTPQDWDVTTSANPIQVKEIFARTIDTGIQHGTVTVMLNRIGYEVTTYRIDGDYEDGRHPKSVEFTADIREDLKRRDFTINAMAYNEAEGILDYYGGITDLDNQLIRCVGQAEERFQEDALRILRAVRFSAQLGFQIEAETEDAIRKLAGNLAKISAERIQAEIVKLLVSELPERWGTVYETGITAVIMPEFNEIADQNHLQVILNGLRHVPADKVLRLTLLLYRMGEAAAVKVLRRLKFDNDTIYKVGRLTRFSQAIFESNEVWVRKMLSQIGPQLFEALLSVRHGIEVSGGIAGTASLEAVAAIFTAVIERGDCTSLKMLAVTGKDLIHAGMQPGARLGEVLQELLKIVLEDPACNQQEYLLEYAKNQLNK